MKKPAYGHCKSFQRIGLAISLMVGGSAWAQQKSPMLPPPQPIVSTVPANGDVDPLGVVFAPAKLAPGYVLQPHDLLISNFNNSQNLQGTGTTVVRVNVDGQPSTFYQGQPGLGLTGAIAVARAGVVFVGNMPTADGTAATVQAGSLLVLDGNGGIVGVVAQTSLINGPWGMAIEDLGTSAHLFISNVLAGTITRLDLAFPSPGLLSVTQAFVIATGFNHRTDPASLVLGPAGMVFDQKTGMLYVASSADNAIYALKGAAGTKKVLTATPIYQDFTHLHGPTQMALAPNGDLLVANSDGSNVDPNQPSEIVEFTTTGQFVTQYSIDPNNGGAFGIALDPIQGLATRIATVDDNQNRVTTLTELVH